MFTCVCSYMVYATYVQVLTEARRGNQIPGAGVTGDCEIPKVAAEKKTHVLQNRNKYSQNAKSSLQPLPLF